jgi:hypothetical protein
MQRTKFLRQTHPQGGQQGDKRGFRGNRGFPNKLESVDVDSASPSAALENLALHRRDVPHAQRLLVVGIHPRVQHAKRRARPYSPQSPVVYVLRDRAEP